MAHLDLERQLCFYGSYHHNKVNFLIHSICVPLILATSLMLATNSPVIIPLPSFLTVPHLSLNLGTLAAIGYSGFYLLLEPVAGGVLIPAIFAATAYGDSLTSADATSTNKVLIPLTAACWIAQFIGHGAFEHRAPALFDNLVQALVLAPFFVWMEILFKFGYRPELRQRVDKAVEKELAKLKAKRLNGAAKNEKAQ
ncbi:MAG: hypothetical protein M1818_000826 [Claussenomyces sp. TS43310]|nr:MAG: hypothetical protein M1818_000826 [Claussenomyces sp. TS43310]